VARTLSADVRAALDGAVDELVYARGWHTVTLDDICERAGVGKPALYRHLGSRDDVLFDYLLRRRERRMRELEATVDAAGAVPRARIDAVVGFYARWIASDDFVGCGFHRALLQRSPEHGRVAALTAAYKAELLAVLRRELRPLGAAALAAADVLFLLIEGAMAVGAYDDRAGTARRLRTAAGAVLDARCAP